MLIGFLGLRTATLISVNIENVDLTAGLLWVQEKGRRIRSLILPHSVCRIMAEYLRAIKRKKGPLLITKRGKRTSQQTLQDLIKNAADHEGIDKKPHARLFRHTVATHLNHVAGIDITQHVLGYALRSSTYCYTHLNPDQNSAW